MLIASPFIAGRAIARRITQIIVICAALLVSGIATQSATAAKYAAMVVDAKSGRVLFSRNADAARYPASLTKIMTLYMLFEEIEAGRMSYSTRLKVSKHAAAQAPSKLGLKPGSTIAVKDAIMALVTKSANDVAAVVAENISGSESAFARKMTRKARSIGMRATTFKNASGLPNSKQRTTARDMIRLGRAIQDRFPKHYKVFKTRSYKYKGRAYGNHNKLLGRVKGVDGIKTGYTRASGFNLVTSVRRDGRHIVAVVMGGKTGKSRDRHMADLIGRYWKKAKRGKRTTPLVVARATKRIPMPEIRPTLVKTTTIAVASPANKRVEIAHAAAAIPMPQAAPIKPVKKRPQSTGSVTRHVTAYAAEPAKKVVPAPIPSATAKKGWKIQIGAMPGESEAQSLLAKAQKKATKHLKGKVSYTEPVEKGESTLWRARFAGFASKKHAKAACRYLKRKRFACYAVAN